MAKVGRGHLGSSPARIRPSSTASAGAGRSWNDEMGYGAGLTGTPDGLEAAVARARDATHRGLTV
jgi:hypothetical protein